MRIMGRPRALLAVLGGALLLAGCGSGPSQLGAAVIIGDRSISVDHVQELIDKAVREQPYAQQLAKEHRLDELGREIVRQELLHEAVNRAAQREGLNVDETLVAQALQKDELAGPAEVLPNSDPAANLSGVVARVRDHRDALVDKAVQRVLALKYLSRLSVTIDFAFLDGGDQPAPGALREQALAKAKAFAESPDAATRIIGADQAGAAKGESGVAHTQAATQQLLYASSALFGSPVNSVVAFQPNPQQPLWLVAVVRQRNSDKPVATDEAKAPTPEQLITIGQRMLQPYLGDISFKVNPRYGVWDVVGMDLAPSEAKTKGVVLPIRGSLQPQQ